MSNIFCDQMHAVFYKLLRVAQNLLATWQPRRYRRMWREYSWHQLWSCKVASWIVWM